LDPGFVDSEHLLRAGCPGPALDDKVGYRYSFTSALTRRVEGLNEHEVNSGGFRPNSTYRAVY